MRTWLGDTAREIALYPRILAARGAAIGGVFRGASGRASGGASGAPRLLALPSSGPHQSSLLRVYRIADRLEAKGWRAVVAPARLDAAARRRVLAAFAPDLVLLQKSRHPLNDPVRLAGRRFVYDLDDADFADPALAPRIEASCRAAAAVVAGSAYVADWCRRFNEDVTVVWTGTPVSDGARPAHRDRAPVVAWAQSDPTRYRAEFAFLLDALGRARARRSALRLRLYGWRPDSDPAMLQALRDRGITVETTPPLPYDAFLRALREVAVGLSPICVQSAFSRGKSFGKVLGYLDARVPVIASDAGDHARFFDAASGVVGDDPEVWAAAIDRLLDDPDAREAMADRAFADFTRRLSIDAAADGVDAVLRRALDAPAKEIAA